MTLDVTKMISLQIKIKILVKLDFNELSLPKQMTR